jgi:hypothetical protein
VRTSLLSCALTTVLSIAASPAQAAPTPDIPDVDQAYTDASGVVYYAFDADSLPGAKLITVEGAKSKSANSRTATCDLGASGSGVAGVDPKVIVGLEVKYDPATCTSQFAVATYPADEVPQVVADTYGPTSEAKKDSREASPEAAAASWYGDISGFYRDPPASA